MGVSVPPPRYAGDGIAHVNASDGRPGCDFIIASSIQHPGRPKSLYPTHLSHGLTDGWPSLDMAAAS